MNGTLTSPLPNGFPSPPQYSFPIRNERFALCGPSRMRDGEGESFGCAGEIEIVGLSNEPLLSPALSPSTAWKRG